MRILVTGAAGFIGMHLCIRLLNEGFDILGLDDLNSYYDISLKLDRLAILKNKEGFQFERVDISKRDELEESLTNFMPEIIVHLAAQAGVRHSINHPEIYIRSNLVGFANILEMSKIYDVKHLMFASSSSVYGSRTEVPFRVSDRTDTPVSLYAATKKSNEVLAYSYADLFGIPITGLRFFTVYGSWGRPDMAYFSFAEKITSGQEIVLFNSGNLSRDFTYIDDIVESLKRLLLVPPLRDEEKDKPPFRILNIGRGEPVSLFEFVSILEKHLGMKANIKKVNMQPGDVYTTFADIAELSNLIGFVPQTSLDCGLGLFVDWLKNYKGK